MANANGHLPPALIVNPVRVYVFNDNDQLSRLPDEVLRSIVHRLPIDDATRTSALSWRWRDIWLSMLSPINNNNNE
ncbi:hypothetical protein PR202_gb05642 [Eleusine coracana subsp. coracana]|uniref:F-box domain-containing protein n=1 Tax=Eleusine coracana subsp. coracana TaxID=191504 RepID=A0AAV5E7I9_ELECO|nr:hypothetical protein PR202_gb05642 [Eleusine coracana subsp. coracana]